MKSEVNPIRVLVKALCLFVIINIVYALIDPQGSVASGYNFLFPGRTRLPFIAGGGPYSVAVDDVDTMFASHMISSRKGLNEYRIVLIGDSSIWGEGLDAYQVISEQWNKLNVRCRDKTIKVYDLGYPHPSAIKDLVILDKAVQYKPDLIIWFITLNTLMSQRVNPFLIANPERVAKVLNAYNIAFEQGEKFDNKPTFYEKTLIGQRSGLARKIKLEMLGIIWTATGVDNNRLAQDELPDLDVSDNPRYHGLQPSDGLRDTLSFSALTAGYEIAEPTPVLIVNEPIFIVDKKAATVRYNAVYPRWAYDQYREQIASQAQNGGWNYLDLWNVIPARFFVDGRFHLSVDGERLLVQQINPALQSIACSTKP